MKTRKLWLALVLGISIFQLPIAALAAEAPVFTSEQTIDLNPESTEARVREPAGNVASSPGPGLSAVSPKARVVVARSYRLKFEPARKGSLARMSIRAR